MKVESPAKTNTPSKVNPTKVAHTEPSPLQSKNSETSPLEGVSVAAPLSSDSKGLPSPLLGKMNHSFGTDFSTVNIHRNSSQASQMKAQAFTKGNDVHFAPGKYQPESLQGQELIGHELAHVVQQRVGGLGSGIGNLGGFSESQADWAGARAAAGGRIGQRMAGVPFGSVQMKGVEPEPPVMEMEPTGKDHPRERTKTVTLIIDGDGDQTVKELMVKLVVNGGEMDVLAGPAGSDQLQAVLTRVKLANPEFLTVSRQVPRAGLSWYGIAFEREKIQLQVRNYPLRKKPGYEFRIVDQEYVYKTGFLDDFGTKAASIVTQVAGKKNEAAGITKESVFLRLGHYQELYSFDFHKSESKNTVLMNIQFLPPSGGFVKWEDIPIPVVGEFEELTTEVDIFPLYAAFRFNGSMNPAFFVFHNTLPLYSRQKAGYSSTQNNRREEIQIKVVDKDSDYGKELELHKVDSGALAQLGVKREFTVGMWIRNGGYTTDANPFYLDKKSNFLFAARLHSRKNLALVPHQQDYGQILDLNAIKMQAEFKRVYEAGRIPERLYNSWMAVLGDFYGMGVEHTLSETALLNRELFLAELESFIREKMPYIKPPTDLFELDKITKGENGEKIYNSQRDQINQVDYQQMYQKTVQVHMNRSYKTFQDVGRIRSLLAELSKLSESKNDSQISVRINSRINELTYEFGIRIFHLMEVEDFNFKMEKMPLGELIAERDHLSNWLEGKIDSETGNLQGDALNFYPIRAYYYPEYGQSGTQISGKSLSLICYLTLEAGGYYWHILSHGEKVFHKYVYRPHSDGPPLLSQVHEELFKLLDDDDFLPKGLVIYDAKVPNNNLLGGEDLDITGTVYLTEAQDFWESTFSTVSTVAAGIGTVLTFIPAPPFSTVGAAVAFAVSGIMGAAGSVYKIMESYSETGQTTWNDYFVAGKDIMTAIGDMVGAGMALRGLKEFELIGTAAGKVYKTIKIGDMAADTIGFIMAEVELIDKLSEYIAKRHEAGAPVNSFEFWKLISFASLNGALGTYVGYSKGSDVAKYMSFEDTYNKVITGKTKFGYQDTRKFLGKEELSSNVSYEMLTEINNGFRLKHPGKTFQDPEYDQYLRELRTAGQIREQEVDDLLTVHNQSVRMMGVVESMKSEPLFYDSKLDLMELIFTEVYPNWARKHGNSRKSLDDFFQLITLQNGKIRFNDAIGGSMYSNPLYSKVKDLEFDYYDLRKMQKILLQTDPSQYAGKIKQLKKQSQEAVLLEVMSNKNGATLFNLESAINKKSLTRADIQEIRTHISPRELSDADLLELVAFFGGDRRKLIDLLLTLKKRFPNAPGEKIIAAIKAGGGNEKEASSFLLDESKLGAVEFRNKVKNISRDEILELRVQIIRKEKYIENLINHIKRKDNEIEILGIAVAESIKKHQAIFQGKTAESIKEEFIKVFGDKAEKELLSLLVDGTAISRKKLSEKVTGQNNDLRKKVQGVVEGKKVNEKVEKLVTEKYGLYQLELAQTEASFSMLVNQLPLKGNISLNDLREFQNQIEAKLKNLGTTQKSAKFFNNPGGKPEMTSSKKSTKGYVQGKSGLFDEYQAKVEKYYTSTGKSLNRDLKNPDNYDRMILSVYASEFDFEGQFRKFYEDILKDASKMEVLVGDRKRFNKELLDLADELDELKKLLAEKQLKFQSGGDSELFESDFAKSILTKADFKEPDQSLSSHFLTYLKSETVKSALTNLDVLKFLFGRYKAYSERFEKYLNPDSESPEWKKLKTMLENEFNREEFKEYIEYDEKLGSYFFIGDRYDLTPEVENALIKAMYD